MLSTSRIAPPSRGRWATLPVLGGGLLLLLLTSCAPSRVLSMVPVGGDASQPSRLARHPDSVYVRLQFVRAEDQELVFEAEFSNAADHPVSIDPAAFYYLPLPNSLPNNLAAPAFLAGCRPANDPETYLAGLAAQRDQQATKAEKVGWLEILTMVANTAEDISSINKKETAAQEAARDARHQDSRADFNNERASHADQAQALHGALTTMASSLLRRATLQPGDRAVGLVYFPRLDAARQLTFVLTFDEQSVPFNFTQELR